jgi:hypothetical protein
VSLVISGGGDVIFSSAQAQGESNRGFVPETTSPRARLKLARVSASATASSKRRFIDPQSEAGKHPENPANAAEDRLRRFC